MKNWAEKCQCLWQEYKFILLLSVVVFLLTRYSVTYGAGSDPRYTLIVSQSILDNGTIQLNAYQHDEIWGAPADFDANVNILKVNGRYYNYFPVGPSLLSIPFVAITKGLGWDMRQARDNVNAQRLLSSLSVVLLLWLVYHMVRVYLPPSDSLVITAVAIFGSTLISTLGVAWWSLNCSVLFIAFSLLLLVRYDARQSPSVQPLLLGFLLFLAYLSRAAAAAFIVPVFLYLGLKDWRQMMQTAVTAALPLSLFLLWSQQEFGTWLPIYYSTMRLQVERSSLWVALLGHLFSPARGLFTFTPYLLLVLPALWLLRTRLRQRPLLWLCLFWLGLHLFAATRGTSWWGGHSFGPRILTELMLPLTLLIACLWYEAKAAWPWRQRRIWVAVYLLLGGTAVFIHSYQGLYNYSTILWNVATQERPVPPFTPPWGDLFNWRYPQILATNQMLCRLDKTRAEALLAQNLGLKSYQWGTPVTFDQSVTSFDLLKAQQSWPQFMIPHPPALFVGWEPVDNDRAPFRPVQCDQIHVYFQITAVPATPVSLIIRSAAFGQQRALIALNGQPVGEWHFTQQLKLDPETAVISLDSSLFQANAINKLTIDLPQAHRAKYNDPTQLSLAIAEIIMCPIDLIEEHTNGQNCTAYR